MGGYVNVVERHKGAVRKELSYTGALRLFADPGIYGDADDGMAAIFDLYENCLDDECDEEEGARALAPFHYGLVVVDRDGKRVFSMQGYNEQDAVGISPHDWQFQEHLLEFGRLGWIDGSLYSGSTGEALREIGAEVFQSQQALSEWMEEASEAHRYVDGDAESSKVFRVGMFHCPFMRLRPAGWEFVYFEQGEGVRFQKALREAGFALSPLEEAAWAGWIAREAAKPGEDRT